MDEGMKSIQQALTDYGYPCGPIDGIFGSKTRAAMQSLLNANGKRAPVGGTVELPWIAQAKGVLNLHESRDKTRLAAFLKSDGKTLGDPAELPWCGDFVETCIKLALPDEVLPGALAVNPYWARNWLLFGRPTVPTYGAVLVFEREGGGGHVGFAVGQSGAYYQVLGGNQSNTVSVSKIAKARCLGARWPNSFDFRPVNLPEFSGGYITTNEA